MISCISSSNFSRFKRAGPSASDVVIAVDEDRRGKSGDSVFLDNVACVVALAVWAQEVVDAELFDEFLTVLHRVEADELHAYELDSVGLEFLVRLFEVGHLGDARRAGWEPEVEHDWLSGELGQCDGVSGGVLFVAE